GESDGAGAGGPGVFAPAGVGRQPAVVRGPPDDARPPAGLGEAAPQPLEQPSTEGVEPLHRAHVDVDVADPAMARDDALDQPLELARPFGRPRAAGAERQPPAAIAIVEQKPAAHPRQLRHRPRFWQSAAQTPPGPLGGRKIYFTITVTHPSPAPFPQSQSDCPAPNEPRPTATPAGRDRALADRWRLHDQPRLENTSRGRGRRGRRRII